MSPLTMTQPELTRWRNEYLPDRETKREEKRERKITDYVP